MDVSSMDVRTQYNSNGILRRLIGFIIKKKIAQDGNLHFAHEWV